MTEHDNQPTPGEEESSRPAMTGGMIFLLVAVLVVLLVIGVLVLD